MHKEVYSGPSGDGWRAQDPVQITPVHSFLVNSFQDGIVRHHERDLHLKKPEGDGMKNGATRKPNFLSHRCHYTCKMN